MKYETAREGFLIATNGHYLMHIFKMMLLD